MYKVFRCNYPGFIDYINVVLVSVKTVMVSRYLFVCRQFFQHMREKLAGYSHIGYSLSSISG
jgi:hypothetical protein